ncbi:DEAD/DEAH box helicase [Paenibacillus glycanilyticus]|uniref:DEAD-box ATP-dependent RNA helicase CshE n=1 Tax=Paenibacillus glycanilyticus TaxID=126569 RepID=A0ABQ6GHW7_9BACL|nr:DEAD/DEAH box helicase [Paenibacillus glycanilyticus]GLX69227.1 DEAD-box ATP-dependent RNA helicase CshE [Paenibacillus glycanilyticus]
MSTEFIAMGIIPELSEVLKTNGISSPTPVQKKAIPVLLAGQDVIAQAQTGTGKTIAFTLPILQRIDVNKEQVQALILTPTRELAIQITSELKKLASAVGAKVLAAYGGQDVEAQIRKLNNAPHIVVATPGRLIDHMRRETINLGKLKMLVLDEADQMLHMGFLPEVESIVEQTPRARQTMLFSATMPDQIKRLAENYMKTPVDIKIQSTNVTLDNIKQIVVETTDRGRQKALISLIETQRPYLAVIFCRTKVRAKKLNKELQDYGFESDELHGDLTQAKREQVMKRFRDAKLQILVATDVAARGLDVEGVTHVFNYDVPTDSEIYIHRIGRTGRAGQRGVAITLASPYDRGSVAHIERSINASLERRVVESDGTIVKSNNPRTERAEGEGRGSNRGGKQDRGGRGRGSRDTKPAQGGRGGRGERNERSGGGRSQASGRGQQARTAAVESKAGDSGNPWEAGSNERSGRGERESGRRGERGASQGGRGERTQGGGRGRSNGGAASTSGGRGRSNGGAASTSGGRWEGRSNNAPRSGGNNGGSRGGSSRGGSQGGRRGGNR